MGVIYRDKEGSLYKIMPGIGADTYKGRKSKIGQAGGYGWKCMASLPWRDSMEDAETDLAEYAAKHGLQKVAEE